jgi:hypothetical protein
MAERPLTSTPRPAAKVDFTAGIAKIEACAQEPLPSAFFATVAFS